MYASGQTPRLVLGYVLGPVQVGLFTLAGRFLDIVMFTMVFPRIAVARIELRTFQAAVESSPVVHRDGARRGACRGAAAAGGGGGDAGALPDLARSALASWGGLRAAPVAQRPTAGAGLLFRRGLLAARLPDAFRRTSTIQAETTAATVLVASPFGLNAACFALALRSWAVLPVYVV